MASFEEELWFCEQRVSGFLLNETVIEVKEFGMNVSLDEADGF